MRWVNPTQGGHKTTQDLRDPTLAPLFCFCRLSDPLMSPAQDGAALVSDLTLPKPLLQRSIATGPAACILPQKLRASGHPDGAPSLQEQPVQSSPGRELAFKRVTKVPHSGADCFLP